MRGELEEIKRGGRGGRQGDDLRKSTFFVLKDCGIGMNKGEELSCSEVSE
jgi:hypothetical protein